MKKVKIFLASSSELAADRLQFENFISRQNKSLIKSEVFLELVVWEDFIDTISKTRLQDEYNKAIRNSDIFVMLFFTKVGSYTLEEFATAYENFQKNNTPKILSYFKNENILIGDLNREDINSLFDFQDKIRTLGHFVTNYKNAEQLFLHFDEQLRKLNFLASLKPIPDNSILLKIRKRTSPYRQTMELIFSDWLKLNQKEYTGISSNLIIDFSPIERDSFIDFYNSQYHSKPGNSAAGIKSSEIHEYLHELHHLGLKIEKSELEKYQVMTLFADRIHMDAELTILYLEAHWIHHEKDKLPMKQRFWNKVPEILKAAASWISNR